jgi:hypothetical protein
LKAASIEYLLAKIRIRKVVKVEIILGYSFAKTDFIEKRLLDFLYKNIFGKKAGTERDQSSN